MRSRRPGSVRCKACKQRIKLKPKGRVPTYCSATCRQHAYLMHKYQGPLALLQQDIATVRFRDFIRREIREVLKQVGLFDMPEPPPPLKPKPPPSSLRLVK
jgi:hypothetical protein